MDPAYTNLDLDQYPKKRAWMQFVEFSAEFDFEAGRGGGAVCYEFITPLRGRGGAVCYEFITYCPTPQPPHPPSLQNNLEIDRCEQTSLHLPPVLASTSSYTFSIGLSFAYL